MDPPLREAMLVRGEVDVISGHYFSSMLDLMAKGVAEDDINVMLYADYGMDFYGNAVIASGAFIEEHPEAVAGFNRAVAKGLKEVIADPAAAVALVAEYDPLIDQALEVQRLEMAIAQNILTAARQGSGLRRRSTRRAWRARSSSSPRRSTCRSSRRSPTSGPTQFLPPAEQRQLTE